MRRHPITSFCFFQFCSAFFKNVQHFPSSLTSCWCSSPCGPWPLLCSGYGGAAPGPAARPQGHIPQWTAPVPSLLVWVLSPGSHCPSGQCLAWAAHTDHGLRPHSGPGPAGPQRPERPAETAAGGSISTQQMTSLQRKGEICLSSARRGPVLLRV